MKTTSIEVKEKKVCCLPGQKHDPPEVVLDPSKSTLETNVYGDQLPLILVVCGRTPDDILLFIVQADTNRLMEHGLLSRERVRKAFEKKHWMKKELRLGTTVKPPKPSTKPETSQKQQQVPKNADVKAKKIIFDEINDDGDFILSPKRRKASPSP